MKWQSNLTYNLKKEMETDSKLVSQSALQNQSYLTNLRQIRMKEYLSLMFFS